MYRREMTCSRCQVELNLDNWTLAQSRNHAGQQTRWRICNSCFRLWRKEKDLLYKDKKATWRRNNYVGQRKADGRIVIMRVIGKRPTIAICELCHREDKPTIYHHWDDSDFSKGVWICQRCHNIAEAVDAGLAQMYLDLKAKINGVLTHV